MSISDLIKNKFVEEFTAISVGTLLTTLLLSFALGLFVLVIYRVTFGGVSFSKSFALSLVMLSMVTSLAILTVRSNVVLSLGMVGALSIVRFRTAIKDPMDTVFMFWSIVIGIITGAGYITVAILAALLLGALLSCGVPDAGLFRSHDCTSLETPWAPGGPARIAHWAELGVSALDGETSALFVLTSILGMHAASLAYLAENYATGAAAPMDAQARGRLFTAAAEALRCC